jgi:hypothetical protein
LPWLIPYRGDFRNSVKTNLPSGLDATGENWRFQGEKQFFHSRTPSFWGCDFEEIGRRNSLDCFNFHNAINIFQIMKYIGR